MSESHEGQGKPDARVIRPTLPPRVRELVNAFIQTHETLETPALVTKLRKIVTDWAGEPWSLELRGVSSVLADLLEQGWVVRPVGDFIELLPPGLRQGGEAPETAKARLRAALQVAQSRQLSEAGVRRFVERMHRVVTRPVGKTSIATVIEDGAALARDLAAAAELSAEAREARLAELVRPVIEVCDEDARCPHSGLRLLDIWRYFRHTWSLEYRSIPGRQLPILIRNSARPGAPVMGIAMLASPVVRMKVRDDWIGWTPDAVIATAAEGSVDQRGLIHALYAQLNRAIAEVRSDDLLPPGKLNDPDDQVLLRLEQRASGAAAARKRKLASAYEEMVSDEGGVVRSERDAAKHSLDEADLRVLSEDPLFVQKRAETLFQVLGAKLVFQECDALGSDRPVDRLLQHPKGARALAVALQEVRKAGLSSQVADLSVCGAVAPYNALLGGKLVALLMASAEVRASYRDRYKAQPSIISSQMAGRLIYRPATLRVLTTTSLYGNGSSQYNRLRLSPREFPGLPHDIVWRELAHTVGYGTHHLAGDTLRLLRMVSEKAYGARRINNRFGEGASPRMRQTREGLEALGIEAKQVMDHATPRLFYGCELHPGARDALVRGEDCGSADAAPVSEIADAWRRRWLSNRITQPAVLDQVRAAGPSYFAARLISVPYEEGTPSDAGEELGSEVHMEAQRAIKGDAAGGTCESVSTERRARERRMGSHV